MWWRRQWKRPTRDEALQRAVETSHRAGKHNWTWSAACCGLASRWACQRARKALAALYLVQNGTHTHTHTNTHSGAQ